MKTHVAIFKSHEEAFKALNALSDRKFPMEHVSLIGKAEIIDDHLYVKSLDNYKVLPLIISLLGGFSFGIILAFGLVSIPSLAFLDGQGVFINIFWGSSIGLVVGAILTIITALIMQKDKVLRYKEHILEKQFLLIVDGPAEEVKLAQKILHTENTLRAVA